MSDKVLICQKCHNPFVYSEFEQQKDSKNHRPAPQYCTICSAIIAQEARFPSKPKK